MIFEEFKYTIKSCNSQTLKLDDSELEKKIYEEFDLGVNSLNSNEFMENLLKENYINDKIFFLSKEMGRIALFLLESNAPRNATYIRQSKMWKDVFNISDKIITELKLINISI